MSGAEGARDASASRPDLYLWNLRRKSVKAHIGGTDGKTLCQIENSHLVLDSQGPQKPRGRKVCWNCKCLWAAGMKVAQGCSQRKQKFYSRPVGQKTEPRLSVLLGEAIDDSAKVAAARSLGDPPWNESPGDNGWRVA